MTIIFSPSFKRNFRNLPPEVRTEAEKKLTTFRANPFTRILKTHKLKGRFAAYFSFSVNYRYRVVFRYGETKETVYLVDIGDHSVYE